MSIESRPLLTFPQGQDLCLACSLLGQAPRTVRYASGTSSPTVEQVKGVWIKRTVSYERETRLLIPAGLPASVIGRPPMDERRGELKGQPGRVAWRRAAEAGPGPRAVWWRGLCSSCSVPCVQRGQLCAPALSGGSGAWTQALSSPGPPTGAPLSAGAPLAGNWEQVLRNTSQGSLAQVFNTGLSFLRWVFLCWSFFAFGFWCFWW